MDDAAVRAVSAPPTTADRESYKQLATLAARGVGVVSAVHGRWDVAVTVTDFLSVSYDPPTMLVSLFSLSRIAEAVTASGRFGLSLLAGNQQRIADLLGAPGAPLVGLLDHVPHSRTDAAGPALIDDAIAWFDLRVTAVHDAATHIVVIGDVVAMSAAARWSARPLVRWRSQYEG